MASIFYHATGGQPWHRKKLNRECEEHSQTAIFPGISKKSVSKSHMLSLTVCVWEFLNNALWDSHEHALLVCDLYYSLVTL